MLSTTCHLSVRRTRLLSIAALLAAPLTVTAQDATPETEGNQLEEIVVTGTSLARASVDTPLAVTSFDEKRLSQLTANSQADILNSVPTIKAEGGGGEVAANVFIKGLPSGGQYQFTPLMYDGMPVFSSFGLNSSAFDVYYRNDLGIERLEFVRGGVSNLFGPGSVAGLINYISKTGSDTPEAKVQLEVADQNRVRGDFAVSGPLSTDAGLYYALSGFYRTDDGPIETGNDTKGFQLRGNIKKEFADDSGSITLFGQYIDDQAQFYLPIPLDGRTRERIPGNDGDDVEQVETEQVDGMSYNVPGGVFRSSIGDGVVTKDGSVGLAFEKDLGSDWGVNGKARYASYHHVFDFFLDGDGLVNVPETQAAFLNPAAAGTRTTRGLPAGALTGTFTYDDTGEALPANALLFPNRFIDRDRPAEDMSVELNLTKGLQLGSFQHNFTLGGFYADAEAKDFNVTTMYLADFQNQARLVNLTLSDGTIISRDGLLNPGIGYVNNKHEAQRQAIYIADQMESDKFIFDIGGRFESIDGDIRRERSATVVTDSTTPNLSPVQRDVVWGNGQFLTGSVSTDEWALALGALYKLTDSVNIYANAARGFFFPELRAVQFNSLNQPQSYTAEIIKQAELGVKYIGDRLSGTVSALYTELNDRRAVSFVNGPNGSVIERVNIVSTESYGMEADFTFRLLDNLNLEGNVTWQEHEFTKFDTNPAFVGNELLRQPNLLYNLGLYYDDGRFDAQLYNTHTGDTFTTESNLISLDAYDIMRLGAGYTFDWAGMTSRIGIDVYNLLDDDGITEGSPRQDTAQAASGAFFVGRPVLPRRYTLRFTVNF
ncbi:MAG TPA: TonB-dependent receptor [Steroidobacteraceae bacterium]|nr:TonB-dependent receptor [Steroidobacteraceae bacterium]